MGRFQLVRTFIPSRRISALWLLLWIPCLYLAVFAYTRTNGIALFSAVDVKGGIISWEGRDFGWPYAFAHRLCHLDESGRLASSQLDYFNGVMLTFDLAISLAISSIVTFGFVLWLKTLRTHGFRFRIATLLLLFLFFSCGLAFWRSVVDAHRRDTMTANELERLGVDVSRKYVGPLFLLRLESFLGNSPIEVWQRSTSVYITKRACNHDPRRLISQLERLTTVEEIGFAIDSCPDSLLPYARNLSQLSTVDLYASPVTDFGVSQLLACAGLKTVNVKETNVSAKMIRQLKETLPNTQILHDE
jgi:hypothetical protein